MQEDAGAHSVIDAAERLPEAHEVGRLARTGAWWSLFLTLGRQAFALLVTMALARLLNPADFGLFAMSATLTVFLSLLSDAGLSWVTVQARDLTRSQVDNLFWVTSGVGAALWGGCVIAGPILVRLYRAPVQLASICAAVGFGFFLSGIAVQPLALLRRRMAVEIQSVTELVAIVAGGIVGVVMALLRQGVWSLVGQVLAYQFVRMVLIVAASGYRPSLPKSGTGTARLLQFGGYLLAYNFVNYFARNLDNILVGRCFGAVSLGFYSRAYFLMTFPTVLATGTLDLVMVPALSALRHDNVRMGAAYRRATRIVAFVGCPMSAMLAVTSPETVRLVYGHKWLPVVPILVWLSVAGVLQPVHNTIGWLYLSSGKARAMFLWGSVASAVLAAGFAVGLRWGTIGIAASYALVMTFVLTVPALYFAHKAANLDLRATLAPICPMIACVLGSSFAALAAGRVVGSAVDVWWAILVAKIVVGVCAYAGLALWLVRPLPIDRLERWVVSKRGAAR